MKKTALKITKPTIIKSSSKTMKQLMKKSPKLNKSADVLTTEIASQELKPSIAKKQRSKFFMIPLFIIVLAAIVYFGKGYIVAAMVNNQPISRLEIISEMETTQGKKTLDQRINEVLIDQEAQKNKVTVSDQEIKDRITTIEDQIKAQGQTLDAALAAQGLSRQDLNKQIKIELQVEKLIGNSIQVTDDEISQSFEQNKAAYPKETTLDQVKAEISDGLKQQKLSASFSSWMQDLRTKANVNYFVSY